MPLKDGRFTVRGSARFNNDKSRSFYSEGNVPALLRDRLLSVCWPIADFYGAQVTHRKIEVSDRRGDVHPLLAQGSGRVQ